MKELNARFLLLGAALACAPCLLADANAAMAESWVGTLPAARFASGAEVPPLDVTGPRSVHVAGDFARFEHVWARLDRGEPARIAVIGGSITQGAGASKPDRRWGETFCAGWRRAFPNARIDFVYCTQPLFDRITSAEVIWDEYTTPIRDPQNLSNFWRPSDHLPIMVDFDMR